MERSQKARCSGRGRGIRTGMQQGPLSPGSPNKCTMQLRDPSVRRPSRHRSDAFEWSPNSKGNRRNSSSKKLIIHLERIPETSYKANSPSEPPKLQHYLQDDNMNLDESIVVSTPPNLEPEILVSRNDKQGQNTALDPVPSTSSPCEPINAYKMHGSFKKIRKSSPARSEHEASHVLPRKVRRLSLAGSEHSPPNKITPVSHAAKSDQILSSADVDNQSIKQHSTCDKDTKMNNNLNQSCHPRLHAYVPHEFSDKRDKSGDSSPLSGHKEEEDAISTSEDWSDELEELFQEPERISTGKETVETIDGVDFLTFETKEDMLEFTAIEMDHIYAPPPIICDEQTTAIVPTKTHDITKIKGWRTKFFAGNNNYNSDYESTVVDIDLLDRSGSLSPVPNHSKHSLPDNDAERDDKNCKEPLTGHRGKQKSTVADKTSKVKEGKPVSKSTTSKSMAKGIGSSHNLDETWVKFAVSALVLPAAGDSSKDSRAAAELSELPSDGHPRTSKKLKDKLLVEKCKIGRPALFPLSPYMKKKMKVIRDSYNKKASKNRDKKIKMCLQKPRVHESKNKIKKIVKETINSMVYTANANNGKIVPASDFCKIKTNRELKKLGHVVIDVVKKPHMPSTSQDLSKNCSNEYCKLGCVCNSLETLPQLQGHCGRVECMFVCTCTEAQTNLAVEKLIEDEKRDLAPAEKDFRNAVIAGDDGIVMVKQRGRREIKMPGRFRDDNMLTGDALIAMIDNKTPRANKSPGKAKTSKEVESEPTYGKPQVKKSILLNCRNPQLNKPSDSDSNLNDQLNQYYNIPSPEILEEPSSRKSSNHTGHASKLGTSPLFNSEGGFISVEKEEEFMATQIKIKKEKQYEYDDDNAIEIDDMGWQSLDAEVNNVQQTTEEAKTAEFGKIVSVQSLAPEEFEKNFESTDPKDAVDNNDIEDVNIEKIRKPKEPLVPGSARQLRAEAKVRAKRLVEFFVMNSSVSALIKSAYEFKPSLIEREAIMLIQWSSLRFRFIEEKIELWILETRQDFHFLVTESGEAPLPNYVSLRKFTVNDTSIPMVARDLLRPYTTLSDYHRCCIFWCNGMHWEFIGLLKKTAAGKKLPVVLSSNSKPKSLSSDRTITKLPHCISDSKWYAISLLNDFDALELKHENLQIPYNKLNQVIACAWRYKKTVSYKLSKATVTLHPKNIPFGVYAIPHEFLTVYLGPYDLNEHALLELVPFEGLACNSKISSLVHPGDPNLAQNNFPATENELGQEQKDTAENKQPRTTENLSLKKDGMCAPRLSVSSKGRTRKIPKHLLDDMLEEEVAPPAHVHKVRHKKTAYQVESIEIPVMPLAPQEKVNKSRSRTNSLEQNIKIECGDEEGLPPLPQDICDQEMNDSFEMSQPTCRKNSDSEDSEEHSDDDDDGDNEEEGEENGDNKLENSDSDSDNEVTESKSIHKENKTRRIPKLKIEKVSKLVCSEEGVNEVPIVIYENGSVRFRSPFGVSIVHFESLDLSRRFLSFLYREKYLGTTLTWTTSAWTDCTKEAGDFISKLQNARMRTVNQKELDRTIGREGRLMDRPIRKKWKPWRRRVVRKNSVVKLLEECEANGNVQLKVMPWKVVTPAPVSKPAPEKAVARVLNRDSLDCSSSSTFNEEEDWVADANAPLRIGETRVLHRDMEKVRRKELAFCFRTLAAMLVPPDMLSRCSKIMILTKALAELKKLVDADKFRSEEKAKLESRRDQLYKRFSHVIEDMDAIEKARSVHQLKELLDALKNSVPRLTWEAEVDPMQYTPDESDYCRPLPVPSETPVAKSQETCPVQKECELNPVPNPKPAKKNKPVPAVKVAKKPRPKKKTATSPFNPYHAPLPPGVRMSEPCMRREMLHQVETPEKEPTQDDTQHPQEDVLMLEPDEQQSSAVNAAPSSVQELESTNPNEEGSSKEGKTCQKGPAKPSVVIREGNRFTDIARSKDLPAHVRITSDAKIYFPPTKVNPNSLLLSRQLVMISNRNSKHLSGKAVVDETPDVVDLSDEEGPPIKKIKLSKPISSNKKVSETSEVSIAKDQGEPKLIYDSSLKDQAENFEVTITRVQKKSEGSDNSKAIPMETPEQSSENITVPEVTTDENALPPQCHKKEPISQDSTGSDSSISILSTVPKLPVVPPLCSIAPKPSKHACPLPSAPKSKGAIPVPPNSQPLVMTQNVKRFLVMPGGEKNKDPKMIAKYAAITALKQERTEKKTVDVPKFVINREVMRARLNAVKPRVTKSTSESTEKEDNESGEKTGVPSTSTASTSKSNTNVPGVNKVVDIPLPPLVPISNRKTSTNSSSETPDVVTEVPSESNVTTEQ